MYRRRLVVFVLLALLTGCTPSLGDAARLWCRDNQPAVWYTGVSLAVFKNDGLDANALLAFSMVKVWDDIEKDPNYIRACTAAYESRH